MSGRLNSTKEGVLHRRELIAELFRNNPGVKYNCSKIVVTLGLDVTSNTILRDVTALRASIPSLKKSDGKGTASGFIYEPDANKDDLPKILDNSGSNVTNSEGYKDPTASSVIANEKHVSEGEIWACQNNKGLSESFLTIRGPFVNCTGNSELITAVPIVSEYTVATMRDGYVLYPLRSARTGKLFYVDPYRVYTKPTKYFTKKEATILEADLNSIRIKIGNFLSIPEKVKYKTIVKEAKPAVQEVKDTSGTNDDEWNARFAELKEALQQMKLDYALSQQKAEIYESICNKMLTIETIDSLM